MKPEARFESALPFFGLLVAALCLLAGLDQRELSASEGITAFRVLGPLENDQRSAPEMPRDAAHSGAILLWRGYATLVGSTERALRSLPFLLSIASLLVLQGITLSLRSKWAACLPPLLFAGAPLVVRPDLLQPALLALFPSSLVLASLLYVRQGRRLGLVLAVLGFGLTGLFAWPVMMALGLLCLALAAFASNLKSALAEAGLGLAAVAVASVRAGPGHGLDFAFDPPAALNQPLTTLGFGVLGSLLLALVFSWRGPSPQRVGALLSILGIATALFAGCLDTALAVTLLPAMLVLPSLSLGRKGAVVATVFCLVAVGFSFWNRDPGMPVLRPPLKAEPGARTVLAHARAHSTSGGRLLASGDDRFSLLYYTRRGQDPGVPLLLVPEDLKPESARAELLLRLGTTEGSSGTHPPILATPPEEWEGELPRRSKSFPGLEIRAVHGTPEPALMQLVIVGPS